MSSKGIANLFAGFYSQNVLSEGANYIFGFDRIVNNYRAENSFETVDAHLSAVVSEYSPHRIPVDLPTVFVAFRVPQNSFADEVALACDLSKFQS